VKIYKAFAYLMLVCLALPPLSGEDSWLVSTTKKAEAGDVRAQLSLARSLAGTGSEEEAEKWYRRAVEQGDVESMRILGRYLRSFSGAGRKKFPDEEISWFEKAVLKGDGESCYLLYIVYRDRFSKSRYDKTHPRGNGVPDSNPMPTADEKAIFDKALAWLSKGLAMNDPQCLLEYSSLYQTGHVFSEGDRQWLFGNTDDIVTIDEKQAFSYIKKAADVGYGQALYLMGVAYLDGKQVPVDYAESLKFLGRAYDSPREQLGVFVGDLDSIVREMFTARKNALMAKVDISGVVSEAKFTAMLEKRFKSLEADLGDGRRWESGTVREMFEQNREAYEYLADTYLLGDSLVRNEKRAFEIYIKLCEVCRYDRSIAVKLGRIYLEQHPLGFDPRRLVDVLEDIVSQGKKKYTVGMLGLALTEGEGAKQKEAERDWMTRQESMLLLAKIYEGGRGIDADLSRLNQLYLECVLKDAQQRNLVAAQRGDAQAQFRIGYILLDGTESGMQRSFTKTEWIGSLFRTPGFIQWSFKQSSDNSFLNAALKLDYSDSGSNRKEAIKWITMAAEQGDIQAQAWLSDIHIHYEDFRNYEQAVRWARKAALRGNAGALVALSRLSLEGRGMPKDEIEAYAYINLAASKDETFRGYFSELESRLPANVRFAGQQRTKQLQKELEDEDLQRALNADKDKSPKKGA